MTGANIPEKKYFCIVGFGEHAKLKLYDSIINSYNSVIAIVSKKKIKYPNVRIFSELEVAVKSLPKNTSFIISSPPKYHYPQAKYLIERNYNVFVEKPIFLSSIEYNKILELSLNNKSLFIECFMYKFNNLFEKFIKIWHLEKKNVSEINISFCIPEFPSNTFRSETSDVSSTLIDIGCYPVSLLNEIGLSDSNLKITNILFSKNKSKELIYISGKKEKIIINIKIGIEKIYNNYLKLKTQYNKTIEFSPFFYGREKTKIIKINSDNNTNIIELRDKNSFTKMFNTSFALWKRTFERDKNIIASNIRDLEILSKQYIRITKK